MGRERGANGAAIGMVVDGLCGGDGKGIDTALDCHSLEAW